MSYSTACRTSATSGSRGRCWPRWSGRAKEVRDFRGAMSGRVDKGLFITTGTFTAEATKEATREGVPLIDLIGGDLLCDELKRYGLGVQSEQVERVTVNGSFFSGI